LRRGQGGAENSLKPGLGKAKSLGLFFEINQIIGFIKGKSAIHIVRVYGERRRNFTGQHFWARGYFVTTVGRDEVVIRDSIRRQEEEDRRWDQLTLDPDEPPSGCAR